MQRFMTTSLLIALFACNGHSATKEAIAAANLLTRHYEKQKLQASVAGDDCQVLVIRAKTRLDDRAVESMHYGVGEYAKYGGMEQFADERGFRAVVYRDDQGEIWTYGSITRDEARSMPRCR